MQTHFLPLLEKLSDQRILCIGDVMLDRYVFGRAERISPEAPIPVLHILRRADKLGGCGNTVDNIASLNGKVSMIGVVGKDRAATDLMKMVAALPQVTSLLITDPDRPTTTKTRYIASSQQLLRADDEFNAPLAEKFEQEIIDRANKAMETCNVIVLSDYAKGVLTNRVVCEIIKGANLAGKRVLIDPKGRDFTRYRGAYMLTPNRKELSEVTGRNIRTVEDAEVAARELIAAHDLQGILAKLGGDGVCLIIKDQPAQHYQTIAREVYDVSGAGDTVVAMMALGLASNLPPADAAALANVAGSIVVGKIGTAVVTREEIARELVRAGSQNFEDKIATWTQAAEMAERWRKQGLKVGFTNGCFDLIHPGHIASIRQARANCDRLIIGLNSDASVKKLGKGDDRPIQNENSRATVLAAMTDVDGIVVFGDDTPLELIKIIRPDVLVKGADYTVETVVGSKEVIGWGGKIVLVPLISGQSTTMIIKRSHENI